MTALGLLIAAVSGWAGLRAVFGTRGAGPGGGLLVVILGAGLGIATLSAVRFWGLVAGLPPTAYRAVEGGLLVVAGVAAVAAMWRRDAEPEPDTRAGAGGYRVGLILLAVLVAAQAGLTGWTLYRASSALPYGMWDAWGFWNTRARKLAEAGDGWRRAFDDTVAHADYPLLLPLTVVRGWEWAGSFTERVGFAVSVAFVALTGLLLFASLRALRGTSAGLMAAAAFLATGLVQAWGPGQYADVPLAFYYVASLACMALAVERPEQSGRWLFALGLALTAAAWTKNEGLPWLAVGVATTGVVILARGVPRPGVFWFAAGLLPLAVTLVVFKLGYAGPNDLVEGQAAGKPLDKLLDPDRHRLIWQYVYGVVPRWVVVLAVVGLLLGVRRGVGLRVGAWLAVQLGAVAAGYYAVYLLTPHDLNWHLGTSVDRLVLQLWPGLLFTVFYVLRTPEEVLAT